MDVQLDGDVERMRNFAKVLINLGIATPEELWPSVKPTTEPAPPPPPTPARQPLSSFVPPPPAVIPHDKLAAAEPSPSSLLQETKYYVRDIGTGLGYGWLEKQKTSPKGFSSNPLFETEYEAVVKCFEEQSSTPKVCFGQIAGYEDALS
eukprot:EG_transcript_38574